jgi:hypothetical protein
LRSAAIFALLLAAGACPSPAPGFDAGPLETEADCTQDATCGDGDRRHAHETGCGFVDAGPGDFVDPGFMHLEDFDCHKLCGDAGAPTECTVSCTATGGTCAP